ncbi:MAG: ABC transporter permease [Gemmatimonadota bacterium]|nr:ABC transporter permease [Gemmatimonadota bacterium]
MRTLKFAFRTLFRTPFVTIVAILSLALGIGANAAIYSMFDQMLRRPLPVREPTQLVNLSAVGPKPGSQSCSQAGDCDEVFSYPMYRDLEKTQRVFAGMAGHVSFGAVLNIRQQPSEGQGMLVTGSYFPLLGVKPALGRLLQPSDDETIGANFVVVISYAFWHARFGGETKVLGEQIVVNGQSMTVVGVTPEGFEGTTLGVAPKVYAPISMRGVLAQGWKGFDNRQSYWIYVFARLKESSSVEQAKIAINALYRPIVNDVEAPLQKGMSDVTMAKFRKKELGVAPGKQGQSSMHDSARTPLYTLLGVTGIVLLIACANIANLLLARGANRSMEMSVRLALGASRRQLLVQLMTESILLASLGGLASLLVAKWTLAGIASMLPEEATSTLHFQLQASVVWFAAAMSVGTGVLFGMFPALHSTRPDLVTSIRANAGQIQGARTAQRFRSTLVTVQIALSMALLISAGLFIKSLVNVSNVDLGVHVDNVVTFGLSPERGGYTGERSAILFHRIEQELAAIPGVTGVTSATVPLLAGSNWGTDVHVQGFPEGPDVDNNSRFNQIGAGYFKTLGVKMIAGREFSESDVGSAGRVAVINESFAKKFKLGNDAVGKFMSDGSKDSLNMQIIGVAQDSKYSDVKKAVPELFFAPWAQSKRVGSMYFYVRTSLPMGQIMKAIPPLMKRLDATLPVEDLKTMPEQIKQNVFMDRMISTLSASFAFLATLLAGIGLYGVLAYTVAQRTREIGVRMALGADSARVKYMVLKQVAGMMIVGGVIGILAAIALGRVAASKSLLYGLKSYDPVVFVLAAGLLAAVAFLAGYVPARRASKVDPMHALRYE